MWLRPQINWDGKLLGCSRNIWGYYAEDVFSGNLADSLNNATMEYARGMLMGTQPEDPSIPCCRCSVYKSLEEYGDWITLDEIEQSRVALELLYDGKSAPGESSKGSIL